MGIQDLGAIGEFVSSLVIVVTLMVLIYEVRGSKRATLQANAQERQRRRDDVQRSQVESFDLANIIVTANHHLGFSRTEQASEFGLEPDQYHRLGLHFARTLLSLQDAFMSELPEEEQEGVDSQLRFLLTQPAFSKWYEIGGRSIFFRPNDFGRFFDRIDEIRATL